MEPKAAAAALTIALACASTACVSIGRPWPLEEPLACATDTRWPTVSVEFIRVHEGKEAWMLEPGNATRERVLWVLGASDLFRAVESSPAVAEWNARIELECREDSCTASLELADGAGASLYHGQRVGEWRAIPGLVHDLLAEARARGIFEGRAP
jgi:hypothetical protein